MPPTVSVVMATYNRSNVLCYAIETVRWQTFEDWELIVVGDACTDDSGAVVASFEDPRIRWVNRAENWGDQSGPNNDGIAQSFGKYVAFLNHDDFWYRDHLAVAVDCLERTAADLVFTVLTSYGPDSRRYLAGVTGDGRFDPYQVYPASCWVVRRDFAERVGPWLAARECHGAPSQDWIWRAYRAGGVLLSVPVLTVTAITSVATGPGAYADRHEALHCEVFTAMRDVPGYRERELTALALQGHYDFLRPKSPWWHMDCAAKDLFRLSARKLGLSPHAARMRIIYLRKGGFVSSLRKMRGLGPLPAAGRTSDA